MRPRILIVDDEAPARARLVLLLADIQAECAHVLVGQADTAEAALLASARLQPDIVLLDVQMPGTGGLALARRLKPDGGSGPAIIFVTAFEEFALQAFEVQACDYLLKPVRAARLAQAITRAVSRFAVSGPSGMPGVSGASGIPATSGAPCSSAGRRHFVVQERGRLLLLPLVEVLYMKAEQKYVTLRSSTHAYLIEESLLSLEQEFAASFVRVHRNALVARHAVCGVEHASVEQGERGQEAWQVIVRGIDERLPVSRRQWPVLRALVRT